MVHRASSSDRVAVSRLLVAASVVLAFTSGARAQVIPPAPSAPTQDPSSTAAPAAVPVTAPVTYVIVPVGTPAPGVPILETRARRSTRDPSPGGRAQLAVGMGILGVGVASEICVLAECNGGRAFAGVTLLGLGAGLGLSLGLTPRRGVPYGQASALNAGGYMGTLLGFEIGYLALVRSDPYGGVEIRNGDALLGAILATQIAGIALAYGLDRLTKPTAGEVAMANSSALYLTGLTVAIFALANDGFADTDARFVRGLFGGLLTATALGLVGGGKLGRHVGASRTRVLLIDAGGILGGGVAMLLTWLIRGDNRTSRGMTGAAIGGAVVGLGTTYVLTRKWDRRDRGASSAVSFSISPQLTGGAVGTISGSF